MDRLYADINTLCAIICTICLIGVALHGISISRVDNSLLVRNEFTGGLGGGTITLMFLSMFGWLIAGQEVEGIRRKFGNLKWGGLWVILPSIIVTLIVL
jgi:hypothetical protein